MNIFGGSRLLALLAALAITACGSDDGDSSRPSSGGTGGGGGSGGAGAIDATTTGGTGGVDAGGDSGSDAGPTDAGPDAALVDFGASVVISDEKNQSFLPTVAARSESVLIAWHDFSGSASRVVYSIVKNGTPGALTPLATETFTGPKRPSAAVTPNGYVLAYQANDGTTDVVRAVELDVDGKVVSGPETISTPGTAANVPKVATAGGREAFAWIEGSAHHFALRGSGENVNPTPVGTTLISATQLNFPRIALSDTGELHLAYRDGGTTGTDWDVLLVTRPTGGSFGAPVNVSKTAGLLSDDIALALDADGTLEIAWVDQDPIDVANFEVLYATVAPGGSPSTPKPYGKQGLSTWTPSVVPGGAAVWSSGAQSYGPLFFGSPSVAPIRILGTEEGGQPALARAPDGTLHLGYIDKAAIRRVHYAHAAGL